MRLSWCLQLLTLGFVFSADICAGAVPPCGTNWFGSPCRYKCHCVKNKCDTNGECTDKSACERGWFGPACQYVDLVSTSATSSTPAWVYDSRCNTDQASVTISLNDTFYFTWLRLRVQSAGTSKVFTLQFTNSKGKSTNCRNLQTFAVNDTVLDIQCVPGVWFQQVTITGDGVRSLCSVYISGGRNVALGQNTSQTSTYKQTYGSWKAVDGKRDSNFYYESCTHTEVDGNNPAWTLFFQIPHQITRYDLYNRRWYEERLQGFTLAAYERNTSLAFRYIDTTNAIQNMYRIWSDSPQTPVSSVKISAKKSTSNMRSILTLCEVEMFGDVACPNGKYGRECERSCNCADRQTCLVSTGMCASGCAAGYQGKTCSDPCETTYYGKNCVMKCSTNCWNRICNATDGRCKSCATGKAGQFCEKDCSVTTFGRGCIQTCSKNCTAKRCDSISGKCRSCVPGLTGGFCNNTCNATYYGDNCAKRCSTNCTGQLCNPSNGSCQSCIAGKTGQFCDIECADTQFGKDCMETCSTNCSNQLCDPVTGECGSCVAGAVGDFCNNTCSATYYGDNCSLACSSNCTDQLCSPVNGKCDSCLPGKIGQLCDQACPNTTFGQDCGENCSTNCTDNVCDAATGACRSCVEGSTGDFCDKLLLVTTHSGGSSPGGLTAGLVIALIILVTLIVVGVLVWRRRSHKQDKATQDTFLDDVNTDSRRNNVTPQELSKNNNKSVPAKPPAMKKPNLKRGFEATKKEHHGSDYCNVPFHSETAIRFTELDKFMTEHGKDFYQEQFSRIPANHTATVAAALSEENQSKNRYRNISAYDHSRVHLQTDPLKNHGDYINASYIELLSTSGVHDWFLFAETLEREKDHHTALNFRKAEAGSSRTEPHYRTTFISQAFLQLLSTSGVHDWFLFAETLEREKDHHTALNFRKAEAGSSRTEPHYRTTFISQDYLQGFRQQKQFIASQGPTKAILEDFVRMLWEQEVEVVVMLTNLIDDGKIKCEQYWPDDGEVDIGELTVKLTTTQVFADFTIRRLCLYKKSPQTGADRPVLVLTHFHFTTWPDKDVPTTAWGLVDLEQRMSSISTSKPIVVHCSAGVGRTGTFIALHNILEEIKHTGYMDVFTTVQKLRQDRMNMVQTFQQYEFVHRATQIAMVCRDTTVTSGNIRERTQHLDENSESGQSKLEKEFQSVCLVCADNESDKDNEEDEENSTYCNSGQLSNGVKHQVNHVLPKEHYRPELDCETEGLGDYINAVLIPSCEKHDQQILTQLPLPATEVDFWRLVTQYKVSLIVAFERHLSTEDMTIGDYLPKGEAETKNCSFFNIQSKLLDSYDAWELQRITVTINEETLLTNPSFEGEHILSHLSWKSRDLDSKCLLALMVKVRELKPAGEGRTLFTCRNGAELSGLACTLSLLLDRLDNDQHVSVPLVVGTVKATRPQIIPTLEQYRLLYQVLNLYNETNNEYSNFSCMLSSSQ